MKTTRAKVVSQRVLDVPTAYRTSKRYWLKVYRLACGHIEVRTEPKGALAPAQALKCTQCAGK